jgi:hypothetical protein
MLTAHNRDHLVFLDNGVIVVTPGLNSLEDFGRRFGSEAFDQFVLMGDWDHRQHPVNGKTSPKGY